MKTWNELYQERLKHCYDIVDLENPQFKKANRVHDWRNHIPYEIKEIWNTLSQE